MKFWTDTKEKGEEVKHYIRDLAKKEKPVTLSDVMEGFGHIPDPDTYNKIFDNEEILKKMRLRNTKDGWCLYLPEPNVKIEINQKPLIGDVCVFETEAFEELIKVIDAGMENIRLSIDGMTDRIIERWMHYEVDVYTGFEKLGEVIGAHYGYFYSPCIVKAKKSGRKEERQDRKAKFHRWADLSKGVRQVVALVEFDDGHIEQVQPDRIIFCLVDEDVKTDG